MTHIDDLQGNQLRHLTYAGPPSGVVQVRVVSDRRVDVFVCSPDGAATLGQRGSGESYAESRGKTHHAFLAAVPPLQTFYVLIGNPGPTPGWADISVRSS